MSCATISPADKSRLKPARPEAQNPHAIAQPTCVEIQIVFREWSTPTPSCGARMITVSISDRSRSSSKSLSVTSSDCLVRTSKAGVRSKVSSSHERSDFDRFVISSHETARFLYTHSKICFARNAGSPRSFKRAVSDSRVSLYNGGFTGVNFIGRFRAENAESLELGADSKTF